MIENYELHLKSYTGEINSEVINLIKDIAKCNDMEAQCFLEGCMWTTRLVENKTLKEVIRIADILDNFGGFIYTMSGVTEFNG